jgi:hypothetical protein
MPTTLAQDGEHRQNLTTKTPLGNQLCNSQKKQEEKKDTTNKKNN